MTLASQPAPDRSNSGRHIGRLLLRQSHVSMLVGISVGGMLTLVVLALLPESWRHDWHLGIVLFLGWGVLWAGIAFLTQWNRAQDRLRDWDGFIRSLGDSLPTAMLYEIVRDPDGGRRFTYVSDGVQRLHACSPAEAIADPQRIYGQVVEEDRDRVWEEEERAYRTLSVFSTEARMQSPSGENRWSLLASSPTVLKDGSIRWDGIEIDITARKHAEESLHRLNEELNTIFDAYPDLSFRLAADGTVLSYRAGTATDLYRPPIEFLGRRVQDLVPSPVDEQFRQAIEAVGNGRSSVTIEYSLPIAGNDQSLEGRLCPMPNGEVLLLVRNITARKRAEEQLNALSLRLLVAQEDERQRLARDLHDEFGQLLAVSKFEAHQLHAKLAAEGHGLREVADRLARDIERAIDAMRTIQRGLYPAVLDHLGLSDAIDTLVSEFQERTGVACVLDMSAEPLDLDTERQRAIYRIVQEALTNAVRHSGAGQVEISLQRNGSHLCLEIRDDGRGIDPASLAASNSYGLTGMRKRAELCGGRLEIRTEPGRGTSVTVTIPL